MHTPGGKLGRRSRVRSEKSLRTRIFHKFFQWTWAGAKTSGTRKGKEGERHEQGEERWLVATGVSALTKEEEKSVQNQWWAD